jgi:hypothetical protein
LNKVINGRTYNTETSKLQIAHNAGVGNAAYIERLYINSRGNFFLHGLGGPMSPYRVRIAHDFVEGEKITPFTIDQAKEWVKSHALNHYDEIFCGPKPRQSPSKRERVTMSLDRSIMAKLRAMASTKTLGDMSHMIENAIKEKYNL